MDGLVSDGVFLANIILLTSHFYAEQLSAMLATGNPSIEILVVEHPKEILLLPASLLANARLISFGSRFYVGPDILEKIGFGAYNFHPGPPTYPGWAPFNFAIYDLVREYGVTVHEMESRIDSGSINALKTFPVREGETVQGLMDLATLNMFLLFADLVMPFVGKADLPIADQMAWQGPPRTKRQFLEMCEFSADMKHDEFVRRMRAFGDGDGEQLPFIAKDGRVFSIGDAHELSERESLWLHGQKFVRVAC